MKQRGALLVRTPPHTAQSRTDADSADYKDPLSAARGIYNALLLVLIIVGVPAAVTWFVVEFAH